MHASGISRYNKTLPFDSLLSLGFGYTTEADPLFSRMRRAITEKEGLIFSYPFPVPLGYSVFLGCLLSVQELHWALHLWLEFCLCVWLGPFVPFLDKLEIYYLRVVLK